MQYTGRLEWFPFGNEHYAGYTQSALALDAKPFILAGIGVNKNKGSYIHQRNSGKLMVSDDGFFHEADFTNFFVDFSYKKKGFSFFTEYTARDVGKTKSVRLFDRSEDEATGVHPVTGKKTECTNQVFINTYP